MTLDGSQYQSDGKDFDYNDRYGIRPQKAWVPYALSFLLIGGAWIVWAGMHHAEPAISANLVAFNNKDPRKIEIQYSITRRDSSKVGTCVITARDINKVIVGQVSDEIPASKGPIQRTVTIPSRADAVNAGVDSCFLK
jgi:hypothetical protein